MQQHQTFQSHSKSTIVLACTLHDPHAGLQWIVDKEIKKLQAFFSQISIVASPLTSSSLITSLKKFGCTVVQRKNNIIGHTYHRAVQEGYTTGADYVFYIDFDRALHWIHAYPRELKQFVRFLQNQKKQRIDYVVCERTPAGYQKHHEALYDTEQLPNALLSQAMGQKKQRDYFAGCFVFSRKAAASLLPYKFSGYDFFSVWPLTLKKKKVRIIYKQFQGLEWETPNQFQDKVKELGSVEAFRKQLSTPEEWKRRVLMARECIKGVL